MSPQPTSQHDWTIHSINIHGVFFERRCQKTVAESKAWLVKSVNYPVEFPPPNGPFRGKESSLDIRAESQREDRLLTLLIECKKNNPELVNWVFFPKYPPTAQRIIVMGHLENIPSGDRPGAWTVASGLRALNCTPAVADEARETRADYVQHSKDRNCTKTSNAAIQEAAHQVGLATKAVFHEEAHFSERLGSANPASPMRWKRQILLPVIVTSAHLFTCEFDPGDVDHVTGEIPYDKATLTEQALLCYEYALPRHLQGSPVNLVDTLNQNKLEMHTRMTIFVIHSGGLADALQNLAASADDFFI